MITITGKHNTAICYTDALEPTAEAQIRTLCDQAAFSGSRIRIMPDVHAGMGCTIGTTMTITDKVVPGMVGVDIGCGMETVRLEDEHADFASLDRLIRQQIPAGRQVRQRPHPLSSQIDLSQLRCAGHVKLDRAQLSIGTLGGGNHFIELGQDEQQRLYLVVHSGSRHLGHETAMHYQQAGYAALLTEKESPGKDNRKGRRQKRRLALPDGLPRDLAYVEGRLFDDYMHDMALVQRFAALNRRAMVEVILSGMGWRAADAFTTTHNYIDSDRMILRKGAVSARKGEQLLIPLNMRDGSLLCTGLGNEDWNQSAPHGAGRLMSRRDAFSLLSMAEYQKQMQGIYSSSVKPDTLDEAPMAYKPMDTLKKAITPTVTIEAHVRPLYNFKAAE